MIHRNFPAQFWRLETLVHWKMENGFIIFWKSKQKQTQKIQSKKKANPTWDFFPHLPGEGC